MRVPAKVASACHPLDAPGPRQRSADLDTLYAEARQVRGELRKIASFIADAGGGRVLSEPDLKERGSAERKIAGKYKGDTARICDVLRARDVFGTGAALYAGVSAALDRFPGVFVQVHDRLVAPKPNGYSDFSLSVRLWNGHIAEIQLHLEQYLVAADIEHEIYEQTRLLAPEGKDAGLSALREASSAAIYGIAAKAVREERPLTERELMGMRCFATYACPQLPLVQGARTSLRG